MSELRVARAIQLDSAGFHRIAERGSFAAHRLIDFRVVERDYFSAGRSARIAWRITRRTPDAALIGRDTDVGTELQVRREAPLSSLRYPVTLWARPEPKSPIRLSVELVCGR